MGAYGIMAADILAVEFHDVRIKEFPLIGPIAGRSALKEVLSRYSHYQFPDMHLVHVPDASIVGPHLFLLDAEGRVVEGSLRGRKSLDRAPFVRVENFLATIDDAATRREITEEVTVVGGKASDAFFHWMVEIVPRLVGLYLSEEATTRPIVMRPVRYRYQRETLDLLNLSPSFVREDIIKVSGAWFPSHTITAKGNGQISPDAVACLNAFADMFKLPKPAKKRRLYISRSDAKKRKVRNESELIAALTADGFEVCRLASMSLKDQIAAFRSAEVVVGQHGAGLTLIGVCSPQTKIVELYPERFLAVSPFQSIASLAGLDYRMLLCPAEPDARNEYHNADISVDPSQVLFLASSEKCDVSDVLVRPGGLELCTLTNKHVLPSELRRCATTSIVALKEFFVTSSVSGETVLKENAVQSLAGLSCTIAEARTCEWSHGTFHPDDIRICRLTGLSVHARYLTDEPDGRLKPLVHILDGTFRYMHRKESWSDISARVSIYGPKHGLRIEDVVLSPSGALLAVCFEARSAFGLRVRHIGGIIDPLSATPVVPFVEGKRRGSRWREKSRMSPGGTGWHRTPHADGGLVARVVPCPIRSASRPDSCEAGSRPAC